MRIKLAGGTNTEQQFAQYPLDIGDGKLPVNRGHFKVHIPDDLDTNSCKVDDLCQFVSKDLDLHYQDPAWLCSRGIICPTNTELDKVNDMMMSMFPGVAREYLSNNSVEDNEHQFPLEFINQLTPSGMPPHWLVLKKNCSIMLLHNFDPVNGHCNGMHYTLQQLNTHVFDAVVATGPHAGKKIFIPHIPMAPSDTTFSFQMICRQFPVRPTFAMTSNKGQGQTLQRVGLYLRNSFSAMVNIMWLTVEWGPVKI